MNLFFKAFFVLAILSSPFLSAQHHIHKCATDLLEERAAQEDPQFLINLEQAERMLQEAARNSEQNGKTASVTYTIPVVFHVIYNDYTDNIGRAQLEDGLAVLNEDFRRLNSDASQTRAVFLPVAADAEIEFALAKIDPNGNCTEGINRIQSTASIDAADNVKPLSIWDNDKYLNIWVVNSIDVNAPGDGTVLGYAYRPTPNQSGVRDGIVIRHDQVGRIGSAVSIGRTLTHEVGHYLGLQHPFSNGCFSGDGVADTPPVSAASFGCNLGANSCSNDFPDLPDMIENYMDYADDVCTNLFTEGQKTIMRASLTNSSLRANIKSSANLAATGVTNPPSCALVALYDVDRTVICEGGSVSFTDQSEDGDVGSYSWSFPGGLPATSNLPNPSVTYPNGGIFDVSLTVTNSAGSSTKVVSKQIAVKARYSGNYPTWSEDFEAPELPQPKIAFEDAGDGITFELFNGAGSSGNQCLKLSNFDATVEGEADAVISPAITTVFTQNLDLTFDYAYAAKNSLSSDELRVYVSNDCGASWNLRRFYRGAQLRTGTDNGVSAYVPAANEWQTQSIGFDSWVSNDPIYIKFEFINGNGNNFYLDNIRFTGTIGEEENELLRRFEIYPNPAKNDFNVALDIEGKENIKLELMSLDGRLISVQEQEVNGQAFIRFEEKLPAGVYVLKASGEGVYQTKRVVVE
jgi:PKD repeat protein